MQDCVHNVKRDQVQGEVVEEVELAEGYVREAEKCKLLLSSLHETTAQREEPTPMNRFLDIFPGTSSKPVPELIIEVTAVFSQDYILQLPGEPVREPAGVPHPAPCHQCQQYAGYCSSNNRHFVFLKVF